MAALDPSHTPSIGLDEFVAALVPLHDAEQLFGFSRSGFFRFRRRHAIAGLLGGKVHVGDIVDACERERGSEAWLGKIDNVQQAADYASRLLPRTTAASRIGVSRTEFWRLCVRHKIPRVACGRIHSDDLLAALDAQRGGRKCHSEPAVATR